MNEEEDELILGRRVEARAEERASPMNPYCIIKQQNGTEGQLLQMLFIL